MSTSGLQTIQVDLVICIDVTASMGPIIENIKRSVLEFQPRLEREMNKGGKSASDLRIRVVSFRDLGEESSEAIQTSSWFEIPRHQTGFEMEVQGLKASGGGSEPESALEALWVAMNSSWRETGPKRRCIIVMLTDASAHDFGRFEFDLEQSKFPTPRNIDELKMRWGRTGDEEESVFGERNFINRRLILLTPDTHPWSVLGDQLERTVWVPCQAGEGLSESEWEQILRLIVKSI